MSHIAKNPPPLPPTPTPEAAARLDLAVAERKARNAARKAQLIEELKALAHEDGEISKPVVEHPGLVAEVEAMLSGVKPATAEEVAADREARRIRPRIVQAGFTTEHLPPLSAFVPCKAQRTTLEDIRRLAVPGSGAIIVLIGPRGTGKTHMAAQLTRDFAEREVASEDAAAEHARAAMQAECWRDFIETNPKPRTETFAIHYMTAARLFGRMKELFSNVGTIRAEERQKEMDLLTAADLVIVDELQEAADGNERRIGLGKILTALCDGRYAAKRPTLLISNHYDPQHPRSLSLITDFLGDSITSRANQYGAFLIANWPSFR